MYDGNIKWYCHDLNKWCKPTTVKLNSVIRCVCLFICLKMQYKSQGCRIYVFMSRDKGQFRAFPWLNARVGESSSSIPIGDFHLITGFNLGLNAVCYVYSLSFFLMTNVYDEAEGKGFAWFHQRSLWHNVKAKELPCVWWFQHWYCLTTWKATAFLVWKRGKLLLSWSDNVESYWFPGMTTWKAWLYSFLYDQVAPIWVKLDCNNISVPF